MALLPFGEWLPDQPDFANSGAKTITNVVPLTRQSYGPMAAASAFSSALSARAQGFYALKDDDGAPHLFAGDAGRLYTLAGAATVWTDASKTAGGPYSTPGPTDGCWSITSFGKRVIATNGVDTLQGMLLGSDLAFGDVAYDPPSFPLAARFCATIRDFVMLGNMLLQGVRYPYRLRWSAIGDPTSFPTPGTAGAIQVQSDEQDLQQTDLGRITGLIGSIGLAIGDGAAFCERGIWRITYAGSPAIFDFSVAQGAAGTLSPLSIVPHRLSTQGGTRAVVYYLGDDGAFYAWDGANSSPIGAGKIDRTFYDDVDPSTLNLVQGAADPINKLIFWAYSASGSASALNRLMVYNWDINRWSLIDLTSAPIEWLVRAVTLGYTLDQLDPFGVLDALPFPLDSDAWKGGRPILAAFDSSHRLSYFGGSNLAPTVETSEMQPFPGRRSKIIAARPIVDGGTPSVSVGHRDRLVDSVTYEAAVAMNALGDCPQRTTGRYVRYRATLPAASSFTHLQGVDVEMRPEGKRR